MKTALIIPMHNQSQYWLRMQTALESLSVLPDIIYLMMDRPSRKEVIDVKTLINKPDLKNRYILCDVQDIPEYVGRPNHTPEQSLFLTGDRRNHAIEYAIAEGCDSFIFIDGDCVPQEDLIKSHQKLHDSHLAVMSIGRRREEKHGWKDQREFSESLIPFSLFKTNTQVITSDYLMTSSAIAWSCNMGLNLKAINRLKSLNKKYYGREDVFHVNFLGTWGGEDGFIGMQAYISKICIVILGDMKSGIKHIEHDRPEAKYAGEAFTKYLETQIKLFKLMLDNNQLPIEFFL